MTDTGTFEALANDLWTVAQDVFRRVFTDVVYWRTEDGNARVAFVGDPLKIAQTFGMLDEEAAGSSPFLPRLTFHALRRLGIRLDEREWSTDRVYVSDYLARMSGQVVWRWADARGVELDAPVAVTIIPEPGYPWPAQSGRYYSAKTKRWKPAPRPAYLVEVEDPDDPQNSVVGVDPCPVFPPDETKTSAGGPICGDLGGMQVMVTHCMSFHGESAPAEVASAVRACGGLLFPSLAVGPIPATNFGAVVLVGHLELITHSLLPYRKGTKRRPCWVYDTDAWTEQTGHFLGPMSIKLFDELHGHEDWVSGEMDVLGVPASVYGDGQLHEPVQSTKELASALRARMRGWTPDLDARGFAVRLANPTSKYAYAEAKAREVVRLDEFPFIIAPDFLLSKVNRFVDSVGYQGAVIHDQLPGWLEEAILSDDGTTQAWALYQWAWQVSEIVQSLRPVAQVRV